MTTVKDKNVHNIAINGNFDERKQKAITSIENLLNFTEI